MIIVENLVGGYGKKPIINGLYMEIKKGEFFALLGPNGSGKSTLFKLITGQLPVSRGEVLIAGKAMSRLSKLEKARKVSVLAQESQVTFDYTVEEIISLGRYPHQKGIIKSLSTYDREVIDTVMGITRVEQYRQTQFRLLSGGEKQRVLLAKALAQEPEVLLLDEPTNHLDIKHTFQMLDLLKEWQQKKGLTIFAILHDLNIASLYADRVALLHDGAFLEVGDVNILRKEQQLTKVYEVEVKTQSHPVVPKPQLLMMPNVTDPMDIESLLESLTVERKEDAIHIQSKQPLRTLSNATSGEGIQWVQHFYLLKKESVNGDRNSKEINAGWMDKNGVPSEQAVGIGIGGAIKDVVIIDQQLTGVELVVVVAIEARTESEDFNARNCLDTIQTMIFIEGYLEDKELLDCYMAAIEAKVTVRQEFKLDSIHSASDNLVVAVNQRRGQRLDEERSGVLRKSVEQAVIKATRKALTKKFNMNQRKLKLPVDSC
ncbi:ABC transporter ATP-binding protein [Sporosarcina sp. G11-34]|uniref:ABC transporter ATP-binding protein n=1 Tax=Sporosarcina sp. G11-34 TaxID=2849605 RepID=UPI0022A9D8DC|nr:ATP-binding cassette domain-containing protein [Sporosarcina sp. G11-34]MCZ2257463.1 ATP-binding cassette domain-containing protein [Sporosarcina sp. G11-34]